MSIEKPKPDCVEVGHCLMGSYGCFQVISICKQIKIDRQYLAHEAEEEQKKHWRERHMIPRMSLEGLMTWFGRIVQKDGDYCQELGDIKWMWEIIRETVFLSTPEHYQPELKKYFSEFPQGEEGLFMWEEGTGKVRDIIRYEDSIAWDFLTDNCMDYLKRHNELHDFEPYETDFQKKQLKKLQRSKYP